jgi:hypothetical protein
MRPVTWTLTLAAVAVACLVPAATGGGALARGSTTGCSDPVVHDAWDGYHLGVPAGWSVFRLDGRLVVAPSGTSPEKSVLAPVLLTGGLTPARYFASSMSLLDKQIDEDRGWNSTSGAVIRLAAGVQHSFTQDVQEWERLSAEQQQFGQQVEDSTRR